MNEWLETLFKENIWTACRLLHRYRSWPKKRSRRSSRSCPRSSKRAALLLPLGARKRLVHHRRPRVDNITSIRVASALSRGGVGLYARRGDRLDPRDLVAWTHPLYRRMAHDHGRSKISKANVFYANLGFGYDKGTWLGRGAVKILPAGFGLDIYLGGLSDRGAMIGLSIDLPAAIPLGATGLGLKGMGGDFAYNFIARLEEAGLPVASPTAKHYVTWARNTEVLDRWQAGPIDQTAVGVGVNTDLVTLPDNGRVLTLEPIGVAVLTPGPVFVLGGVGKMLSTNSARVEGIWLSTSRPPRWPGMGVIIKIPPPKSRQLWRRRKVHCGASGTLDAFFSFSNPSSWNSTWAWTRQDRGQYHRRHRPCRVVSDAQQLSGGFGAGITIGGK